MGICVSQERKEDPVLSKLFHTIPYKGIKIDIIQGDVLQERADAIVNSSEYITIAQTQIMTYAGASITNNLKKRLAQLKVGDATHTESGDLKGKYKHIIHAILPNFTGENNGGSQDLQIISEAFYKTFQIVQLLSLTSVVFTEFKNEKAQIQFPSNLNAQGLVSAIVNFLDQQQLKSLQIIKFVTMDQKPCYHLKQQLDGRLEAHTYKDVDNHLRNRDSHMFNSLDPQNKHSQHREAQTANGGGAGGSLIQASYTQVEVLPANNTNTNKSNLQQPSNDSFSPSKLAQQSVQAVAFASGTAAGPFDGSRRQDETEPSFAANARIGPTISGHTEPQLVPETHLSSAQRYSGRAPSENQQQLEFNEQYAEKKNLIDQFNEGYQDQKNQLNASKAAIVEPQIPTSPMDEDLQELQSHSRLHQKKQVQAKSQTGGNDSKDDDGEETVLTQDRNKGHVSRGPYLPEQLPPNDDQPEASVQVKTRMKRQGSSKVLQQKDSENAEQIVEQPQPVQAQPEHVQEQVQKEEEQVQKEEEQVQKVEEQVQKVEEQVQKVEAQPEHVQEQVQKVEAQPEHVQEQVQNVQEQVQNVQEQVQKVEAQPENVHEQHQPMEAQPQSVQEQHQPVEAQPENVQEQHQPVEAQPEHVQEKAENVQEQPQPVEAQPENVQQQTEHVHEQHQPVEAQPENAQQQAEHVQEQHHEGQPENVQEQHHEGQPENVQAQPENVQQSAENVQEQAEHVHELHHPVDAQPENVQEKAENVQQQPQNEEQQPQEQQIVQEAQPVQDQPVVEEESKNDNNQEEDQVASENSSANPSLDETNKATSKKKKGNKKRKN